MSKTLKTKKRILGLLKKKEMTISGLSQELGLSTATISQHMEELQSNGIVEKVENEHFKKLKYYKVRQVSQPMVANYAKYIIGAVIVIALASVVFYSYNSRSSATYTTTVTPNAAVVIPTGGAEACPMMFYSINGSIGNYSGFSKYNISTNIGTVADYVIKSGETGKLYVAEQISNVLPEPANFSLINQTHYITFYSTGNGTNSQPTVGLNYTLSPQNYTVKNNTTVYFTINLYANSTTANDTYVLRMEGPCHGIAPVLITVGNYPYNGTVVQSQGIIP